MVSIEQIAKEFGLPVEDFSRRMDGRIEWHCKCGVGHTVWYPKGSSDIHGCCGCCKNLKTRKVLEKNKKLIKRLADK